MSKKNISIQFIIFTLVLVFLNLVSQNLFKRFDLTQTKIYTLTKSSKHLVEQLDDRLIVKAYFSDDLPGEYNSIRRYVKDMLAEYNAYSNGNFHYKFIDPSSEDKLKKDAQKNGIRPVPMRVLEDDKVEMREVYLGLSLEYQGKNEIIPLVESTEGFEYNLTSKINKITAQNLTKVAFFGFDEMELPPNLPAQQRMMMQQNRKYPIAKKLLQENFELIETKLEEKLSADVNTLIVAGVNDSLSQNQLRNLDSFVMKGGNIIFFQDRVQTFLQEQRANLINSNLFELLDHYGIHVKSNLVTDAQCIPVTIQQQQGFFSVNRQVDYPFILRIDNLNSNNPVTKNLGELQMIFASEIIPPKTNETIVMTELFKTSENTGEIVGPRYNLNLQQFQDRDLKKMLQEESKIVGALYKGIFESYFTDKSSENPGKIIYIPDSEFIQQNAGIGAPGNQNFLQNAVDFLSDNEALISLRSRKVEYKPLKENISDSFKKTIKWLNILLPTLILIIIGLVLYKRFQNKRKMLRLKYE